MDEIWLQKLSAMENKRIFGNRLTASGYGDDYYRHKRNEEIKRTTNRCGLITNECPARVSKNTKYCKSCFEKIIIEGFERVVGPTGETK